MSRYTQSIKSILMANKQQGESLQNLSDLYAISSRAIFDIAPMNVINSDYRQRLITGFTLHFMNDEIGMETPLLFKLGLSDKIYNNAEYINAIFANLDKQIFADYSTKSINGEAHQTIADDTVVDDTGTVTNAKSGDDTVKNTGTSANAKTGTETGAHTGTDTQVKSGDDTLKRTGQSSDTHTGTNTHRTQGDDTLTKSGTETHTYNNVKDNMKDLAGSKDWTENDEHYSDTVHNEGTDKDNSGNYNLDTPMNQIENLRSTNTTPAAAYDATGKGIYALTESSMKYMTSASLSDDTKTNESDQTTWHNDGGENGETSKVTTHYEKESENTKSGSETDSYTNRQDVREIDTTLTDSFNEANTKTDNLQDKTEYNSTTQDTKNLTDTTTFNTNDTRTDNLQSKTEYNSSNVMTNDLNKTVDKDVQTDTTNTSSEVSTNLNLEMIYRSMPLLDKLWETFDELFMSIY